jgi:hypothetical protein
VGHSEVECEGEGEDEGEREVGGEGKGKDLNSPVSPLSSSGMVCVPTLVLEEAEAASIAMAAALHRTLLYWATVDPTGG